MNRYPLWKNLLVLAAVVIGFIYALPNIYAPDPAGVALFDGDDPVNGDLTGEFALWDAGTEQNREPGVGPDQAPRQDGPDTGPEEDAPVRHVEDVDDMHAYPDVSDVLEVTVSTM